MTIDPGIGNALATNTAGGGYPKFVDLGNGYTIVYTDPYDAGSIVSTKKIEESGGGGGVTASTAYAQQQQNAREAAQLAEQQRQYDLTQGERKARGDQEQQLAEAEAAGYFRGAPTLSREQLVQQGAISREQLAENQRQFDAAQGLDYYKHLAATAASPRNFVESFFLRRGQPVPANAAMYGNTGRSMQGFMGATPQVAVPRQVAPSSAYPTGPLSTPPTAAGGGYASPYEGLSGFGQNGMLRLAPNDPDAAGLMAKYPGRYEVTNPTEAAKYLPRFAMGGRLHMNGPHAVINLMTGKPVAIAGEAGPENAYFDGAAIIDPYASGEDQYMPGYEPWANVGIESTYQQPTGSQYMPGYEPTPYSPPPVPAQSVPQQTSAFTTTPEMQAYIDEQNALTRMRNQGPPPPSPTAPPPVTQPSTLPTGISQPPITQTAKVPTAPYIPETIPAPEQPVVNQPGFLPQGGQTAPPPVFGGVTPRDVAAPGTFGGISGSGGISGARPQFLGGEDQSTLAQLTAAGIVPPFLQRQFAQSRGVQSQGTNQPLPNNFPRDVTLPSKISWLQMNPDERQAFLSYASSYGVTPEEMIAAIEANAPQGGETPWSQFGVPFAFNRQ